MKKQMELISYKIKGPNLEGIYWQRFLLERSVSLGELVKRGSANPTFVGPVKT